MSSSPPTPSGVAAYSTEVSSTPRRVDIYLFGEIGPVAAEHLESLLAMVDTDTPIRDDLSGVSFLDARWCNHSPDWPGPAASLGAQGCSSRPAACRHVDNWT